MERVGLAASSLVRQNNGFKAASRFSLALDTSRDAATSALSQIETQADRARQVRSFAKSGHAVTGRFAPAASRIAAPISSAWHKARTVIVTDHESSEIHKMLPTKA
jgi:hypothetical protein